MVSSVINAFPCLSAVIYTEPCMRSLTYIYGITLCRNEVTPIRMRESDILMAEQSKPGRKEGEKMETLGAVTGAAHTSTLGDKPPGSPLKKHFAEFNSTLMGHSLLSNVSF